MSHFGKSGPPDIIDTYSLLVLNISFRTTADDLFPYFDKYGKVVDIFIPRDRRTGESRGFAFVRYKYQDEAQKAVDRLDGANLVDYSDKGRVIEPVPRTSSRLRSHSPRRRYRDDYHRDYDYSRRRSRSRSLDSASPRRDSLSPRRSLSPRKKPSSRGESPDRRSYDERSPTPRSVSPRRRPADSQSPSPRNSDLDVSSASTTSVAVDANGMHMLGISLENIYHRPLSLFDLCSLAHGAGDCSCEVVADVFSVVRYEFVGVALK
ncbi:hypothetical protein C3L33_19767, partial [Rhododendron williamsianum]